MRFPCWRLVAVSLAIGLSSLARGERAAAAAPAAILITEFIADEMPTPSCHVSTIVEAQGSLLCAWFGGKAEGDKSVGVWLARQDGKNWGKPIEVATGESDDGQRYPCWNPVLFQP